VSLLPQKNGLRDGVEPPMSFSFDRPPFGFRPIPRPSGMRHLLALSNYLMMRGSSLFLLSGTLLRKSGRRFQLLLVNRISARLACIANS
jgi:hypothetical protein